ncbi:MAG TPA: hypothetical protein VGK99_05420 [Acidobacteriota bacterium]|jgi:hypothetical protein
MATTEQQRAAHKKWFSKDPEKARAIIREISRRYRAKHSEKVRQKDRERGAAKMAKYREKYPERVKAYYEANIHRWHAQTARRRASKSNATPVWADKAKIAEFYRIAAEKTRATGMSWEVDHIVPLHSKFVCGLHVENNLQVIPATVNRVKFNKWWPDMPEGI